VYDDENVVIEYKSREIEPWKIAKEMVAFANSKGGKLIFGIDDEGNVVGIELPKKLEETIINISRNNCQPPIVPEVERQSKEGKTIVVVKVSVGNDRPYKTEGRFYIRVGSTVREASSTELVRLFSEGPYKALILMLARLTDIKNEVCAALEAQSKEGDNVAIMKTLELKRAILSLKDFDGVTDGIETLLDVGKECSIQFFQVGKSTEAIAKISQIISKIGTELEYSISLDDSQAEQIWQMLVNGLMEILRIAFDIERPAEPFSTILHGIEDVGVELYKRNFTTLGNTVALLLRDFREHLEFWQSHLKQIGGKSLPADWAEILKLTKEAERYFPIDSNKLASVQSFEIHDYFLFNQAFIEGWDGDWLDQTFRWNPDRIIKAAIFWACGKKDTEN